ncbi:MAG: hypothetical protein ACI392_08830 [Paludibacteraceae bacterium]
MAQSIDYEKVYAEWNQLVSYCCAKYEIQYFELVDPNHDRDPMRNAANDLKLVNLKSQSMRLSYIDSTLTSKKISEDSVVKYIYHYFDSIAKLPQEQRDFEVLFPMIKFNDISFEEFANRLRKDISPIYAYSPEPQKIEKQEMSLDFSVFEISIMILMLIFAIVIIIMVVRLASLSSEVSSLHNRIHYLESDVHNIKLSKVEIPTSTLSKSKEIVNLSERIARLESVILDLNTKVATAPPKETKKEEKGTEPVKTAFSIFLKNFNAGAMKECSASEAQYKLVLADAQSTSGEFSFAGDINSALATKDATFEDVCDLENWNMSSKSCSTIEKGKAEKIAEGKWKVVKKAKIKFS